MQREGGKKCRKEYNSERKKNKNVTVLNTMHLFKSSRTAQSTFTRRQKVKVVVICVSSLEITHQIGNVVDI